MKSRDGFRVSGFGLVHGNSKLDTRNSEPSPQGVYDDRVAHRHLDHRHSRGVHHSELHRVRHRGPRGGQQEQFGYPALPRITLFRAKEGRYPTALQELVTTTYVDVGAHKPYLPKIPAELISNKKGNNGCATRRSDEPLTNEGGWVYRPDTAEVLINVSQPLDKTWGDYTGQTPSEW